MPQTMWRQEKKLGEFAASLLKPEDQIAIVAHVKGVSTAVEREKGFREGLGKFEKNIVDVVYCDSRYDKSYDLTMELIRQYPGLKMIAGMNEYSSVGAARAVKAAGAEKKDTGSRGGQFPGSRSADGAWDLSGNRCSKGF